MIHLPFRFWRGRPAAVLLWVACLVGAEVPSAPAPKPSAPPAPPGPAILTLDQAVRWALQYNPGIAAVRQQHGIAAAAVVIARTYPFNPVWEGRVQQNSGPESAGITNLVANEHLVLLELELRGQGQYRRQNARAALTRTDWEIAQQEVNLAVRVIRGYNNVLYRLEKIQLARQIIAVNEEADRRVRTLVSNGKLGPADLITIRTELEDARAQIPLRATALVPAWQELRQALGLVAEAFRPTGRLETPARAWDPGQLTVAALRFRPDLRAHQAAVAEAEAQLRLTEAGRYGNLTVGPAYTYDPTRVSSAGVQFAVPLPVLNTHRGEILQRQAEVSRAVLELRQTEVLVRQEVRAALARIEAARRLVETYQRRVIPDLETAFRQMNQLLLSGAAGVDALRVIDINRKLLTARDAELDARWELSQAEADLVAAVGDPALVLPGGGQVCFAAPH